MWGKSWVWVRREGEDILVYVRGALYNTHESHEKNEEEAWDGG